MEETISLKELFQILKKRLGMILIITVLAGIIGGVYSYYFVTPVYQTSTQLLVNQAKNENGIYNPGEVQANLQLINTYSVIIKSPAILEKVADELGTGVTAGQLNKKVSVSNADNSQVVNLTVQDFSPQAAADIANKTAEVFQNEIVQIMNIDNVSVLARAQENPYPTNRQPVLNIAIALVVGLMLSIGLTFLIEYLDNTIKGEQDIEKILGLPVLGTIAKIDSSTVKNMRKRTKTDRHANVRSESIGS